MLSGPSAYAQPEPDAFELGDYDIALAPPRAPEPDVLPGRSLDATGYLLDRGQIEIGLWNFGYGITDWLNIGTVPAPWLIAPVLDGVSANLSLKLGFSVAQRWYLALEVNPIWVNFETGRRKLDAWLVPVTAGVSLRPVSRQSYSLAVRYAALTGDANTDIESHDIAGALVTSVVQVVAQAEYRFTHVFGLYLQGYLQVWEENLRFRAGARLDDRTRAAVDGELDPTDGERPWAIIAGAHFRWGVANLRIGVGYNEFFVTRIGLALRKFQGPFPDVNFYFRF